MLPGRASQTMLRTALRRAEHQLLDHPRIFEDPIAVGFVPEGSEQTILAAADELRAPTQKLLRLLFALRSRFAEDRLARAAARGACQYLIVGAGLDTFPWRQPKFGIDLRIFWVDHPASLTWSTAYFRERGLTVPANVSFVAADLEERHLAERLAKSGFDCRAVTFCSALGVTQYLGRDAVESLLRFAASWPIASEIVCTFSPPDDTLDGDDLAAAHERVPVAARSGEPWKTRLTVPHIFGLLAICGFAEVFHLTRRRAQQQYFGGRGDTPHVPQLEQLFAATI
jgi:methyltransferase (TIGR00027 family)